MILSKQKFLKLYNKIHSIADKNLLAKEYEKVISLYEIQSSLSYFTNIFYTDKKIEDNLLLLSKELVKRKVNFDENRNQKIIFFDSFGWDNKGLTQQYIRALIDKNIEFLFVFENFNDKISQNIQKELNDYPSCKSYKIQSDLSKIEKINALTEVIEEYKPTDAFLHLNPSAVTSIIVWNSFIDIKRYQINLTDHAFWLGVNAFDYCIEFRDYGYNISKNQRNIAEEKVIKLPYYPIIDEFQKFEGFPKVDSNKIIIVSGASYYKVFGGNDKYFKLLKKIKEQNKNIVVFFAGSGNTVILNKLIKKYNLKGFFIPIGERKDISQVVRNADIYLATYPLSGGLMSLFAIKSEVPIIGFTEKELLLNSLESLVELNTNNQLTYFDEDSFLKEMNIMIQNKEYRINKAKNITDSVISIVDFNSRVLNILSQKPNQNFKKIDINLTKVEEVYLEVQNNYQPNVVNILFYNLNQLQEIKYEIIFLKLHSYFLNSLKKIKEYF
ncbi:MAG: hypothetical protein ACEQSF_02310 [Solirubrobacteraceae bacterium]